MNTERRYFKDFDSTSAQREDQKQWAIEALSRNGTVVNLMVALRPIRTITTADYGYHYSTKAYLSEDDIRHVSRKFNNALNAFYFGKKRNQEDKISFFAFFHEQPHSHLHILFTMPAGKERSTIDRTRAFVIEHFEKEDWVTRDLYCELAESVPGSVLYNQRSNAPLII